tara:strand:- start:160 stop:330 length:171 start_codon:yes stop_codon:yes gene_type:complete
MGEMAVREFSIIISYLLIINLLASIGKKKESAKITNYWREIGVGVYEYRVHEWKVE